MGRHRLKDLIRSEHVYQINVEGLDDIFPPLASLDGVPNNLPVQLTDFIRTPVRARRGPSVSSVRHGFSPSWLRVAPVRPDLPSRRPPDLITEYPDGVFFMGLADISSSDDILQTVAESLGLGLSSGEDLQTQLLTYLAKKRQLLVFDNLEHLTDGGPILSTILRAAPEINVLVTSRSRLNVTGEKILTLGGLETAWDTREEALETSGVQLFIDAAKRSQPGLTLESGDLDPLSEILRLTGGMPLGIEAAAWVDMLSITEIASEIAKSLDFLETDAGDVPDRHRSVRAAFDYTWKLLSPKEQSIFAGLAVFRGGFTREAATAVAGASLRELAQPRQEIAVDSQPGHRSLHGS